MKNHPTRNRLNGMDREEEPEAGNLSEALGPPQTTEPMPPPPEEIEGIDPMAMAGILAIALLATN